MHTPAHPRSRGALSGGVQRRSELFGVVHIGNSRRGLGAVPRIGFRKPEARRPKPIGSGREIRPGPRNLAAPTRRAVAATLSRVPRPRPTGERLLSRGATPRVWRPFPERPDTRGGMDGRRGAVVPIGAANFAPGHSKGASLPTPRAGCRASGVVAVNMPVCFYPFAHRAAGPLRAPASRAPPFRRAKRQA